MNNNTSRSGKRLLKAGLPLLAIAALAAAFWRSPMRPAPSPAAPTEIARPEPAANGMAYSDQGASAATDHSRATPAPEKRPHPFAVPVVRDRPVPAHTAFAAWLSAWRAAAPAAREQLLAEGAALALARRGALKELISTDPRRALALAMPAGLRSELPPAVSEQLEQRIDARGDYEVIAGCFGQVTSLERWALVDGRRYRAFVFGRRENQATKHGLPLHGLAVDDLVALDDAPLRVLDQAEETSDENPPAGVRVKVGAEVRTLADGAAVEKLRASLISAEAQPGPQLDSGNPPTAAALPAGWTIGQKRVLWLKVEFPDDPGAADTDANILKAMRVADTYFQDVSNGRCSLVTTILPALLRVSRPKSAYGLSPTAASTQLGDEVRQLARAYDQANGATGAFNPDRFDRWVVFHKPPPQVGTGGFGYVGAAGLWIMGPANPGLLVHELGHNQGLQHTHGWDVSAGESPISRNGTHLEYGYFDVMGSSKEDQHFNAPQKDILGYLDSSSTTTVTQSGTYRVFRHDHRAAAGVRALRLNFGGAYDYWVEYRRLAPPLVVQSPRLQNGVLIHWGKPPSFATGLGPYLLDMTPGSNAPADSFSDIYDAPLAIGETFSDAGAGIHVTPIGVGGSSPREYIDVRVEIGSQTGNRNPTLQVNAPTLTLAARADFPYSASGSDPDGDPLYWRWNFGDYRIHPSSPNITQRYLLGGTFPVTVSARDGKGGSATSSFSVTVTDPLTAWTRTASLTGRALSDVVFAAGQFVAVGNNAAYFSPDGQTWTVASSIPLQNSGGVAYGGGRYVAVGGRSVSGVFSATAAHSTNGQSWTAGTVPSGIVNFASVAYGAGRFVAVGSNGKAAFSADGAAWTESSTGVNAGLIRVRFANGLFVAAGNTGCIITSTDGITWTDRSVEIVGDININYQGVVNYGGRWFVSDGNEVRASADGAAWAKVAGNPALVSQLGVGLGALIGFGSFGNNPTKLRVSENGEEWSATVNVGDVGEVFRAMAEGNGAVVMVGFSNGGNNGMIYTAGGRPAISTQPASQAFDGRASITLSVVANTPAVTYQWHKDGVAIPGASGASLVLANNGDSSAGSYTVTVSNSVGSVTSSAAVVTVSSVIQGRISNLAIRSTAGTGAETLIVGVTIGGTGTAGTKAALIRGIGPALTPFGVANALGDPRLELFRGSASIAANDNWGGDAAVSAAGTAVGAFGLSPANSRDAAYFGPALSPGGYTVQITGVGGATGVALAEIYDATPAADFTAATPRLINVSARTLVGTGGNILIAGFTIAGATSRQVLIRAVGPTLATFGVAGILADPKLELFRGSTKIDENDNWPASVAATATSVGAFGLNAGSRDAVLLVTLAPGSYTAQVSGVGNTTGVALVEVYEVP